MLGFVFYDQHAIIQRCTVFSAGASDCIGARFLFRVADPGIAIQATIYVATGDHTPSVGELLRIRTVEHEGAHFGITPGFAFVL